ncbi:MAG: phosphatase PAP2 family protein [Methanoregula sp.]|nr:phosphatase PAP2 family protein [Methanoregula sp.]
MTSFNLLDPGINSAAQNLSPALTVLIAEGHIMDTTAVYLLVIAALYLGFHPRHGIRLAVLFGITAGINEALKLVFHLPRPYWVSNTVKAYAALSSFGFPSGAAVGSVVMYGYIALVVRRWWVYVICGILFAWTVLARIFAGVHFLLDIIGGLLFGSIILILSLQAFPKIESWAGGLSVRTRILGIVLVSLFPLIVVIPAYLSLAGWQVPSSWAVTAMEQTGQILNPVQIGYAWTATGILLGSLLGYQYLLMRGGWSPPDGLVQRCVVVAAGMGSILVIDAQVPKILQMAGLAQVLPDICDLVTMTLICFWLTACIPLIARRAGAEG